MVTSFQIVPSRILFLENLYFSGVWKADFLDLSWYIFFFYSCLNLTEWYCIASICITVLNVIWSFSDFSMEIIVRKIRTQLSHINNVSAIWSSRETPKMSRILQIFIYLLTCTRSRSKGPRIRRVLDKLHSHMGCLKDNFSLSSSPLLPVPIEFRS